MHELLGEFPVDLQKTDATFHRDWIYVNSNVYNPSIRVPLLGGSEPIRVRILGENIRCIFFVCFLDRQILEIVKYAVSTGVCTYQGT